MELIAAIQTAIDKKLTVVFLPYYGHSALQLTVIEKSTGKKYDYLLDPFPPQHIVAGILIDMIKEF